MRPLLSLFVAMTIAGVAVPAAYAETAPVRGAVKGTATVGKGVVQGAGQAGEGVVRGAGKVGSGVARGTGTAVKSTGRGLRCIFTLGNRC
jgi:hypothetical protein